MAQSIYVRPYYLLMLLPLFLAAEQTVPLVIRQSSIYDYPPNFEEIYQKQLVVEPPARIAAFVDRPASSE